MSTGGGSFAFGDDLPLEPIAPGTTILVAGPGTTAARELALLLVLAGADRNEGMVLASTATHGRGLLEQCRALRRGLDDEHLRVVDATGLARGSTDPERVAYVEDRADLSAIGIDVSSLHDDLLAAGVDGVRTVIDSLTGLLAVHEFKTVFKFVNILTNRVRSYDGLGILYLETSTLSEEVIETFAGTCDGRITVGADGRSSRLRVDGLPDQPGGWHSFDATTQWPRGIGHHVVGRQVSVGGGEARARYECARCDLGWEGELDLDRLRSTPCR